MTTGFEFNPLLPDLDTQVAESFLVASWLAVLLLDLAFVRQGSLSSGLWAVY